MIDVIDRVPTYPGRVRLIPVAGQANTYDMVRADDPLVEGTPLNKALFDGIDAEIAALQRLVADTMFEMSQRVPIGTLSAGSVFSLYENGIRVPFLVVSKSWLSTGRTLVMRQDIYKMDTLFNEGERFYPGSKADLWLTNEYINYLDPATQGVLTTNTIASLDANSNDSISRKIFLLATREYGIVQPKSKSEGDLSTFFYGASAEKKIALYNGVASPQWTRSVSYGNSDAGVITAEGTEIIGDPYTDICGYRPAFTLPANFEVTAGAPNTANTMATAEVL